MLARGARPDGRLARRVADVRDPGAGRPPRRCARPAQPVRLAYDASLFTGPAESPFWRADYVPDDIVSPIAALWVDEGIAADRSERVADPAADAAAAFAAALAEQGVKVQGAVTAAPGARRRAELAAVSSPPLSQIAEHVIEVSDNEGAEVLAHHVGLAVGRRRLVRRRRRGRPPDAAPASAYRSPAR